MHLLLGGEPVEQVGLRQAGGVGDLVEGRAAEAVGREDVERGGEDRLGLLALDAGRARARGGAGHGSRSVIGRPSAAVGAAYDTIARGRSSRNGPTAGLRPPRACSARAGASAASSARRVGGAAGVPTRSTIDATQSWRWVSIARARAASSSDRIEGSGRNAAGRHATAVLRTRRPGRPARQRPAPGGRRGRRRRDRGRRGLGPAAVAGGGGARARAGSPRPAAVAPRPTPARGVVREVGNGRRRIDRRRRRRRRLRRGRRRSRSGARRRRRATDDGLEDGVQHAGNSFEALRAFYRPVAELRADAATLR